ncbi:MAG: rod shape-determining protein MreD [Anaerolineae bacterium]|nr:rod shape-determining protein MreD [Anaerolineae bacterium]
MSLYFGVPILLVGAVLQSTWIEDLRILGGRPDLVLLLVVTWAIIRGLNEGVLWGFIGGAFMDSLSGGPFGVWTVTLTAVGLIAGQGWVQRLGPTSIRLALMAALSTLLGHALLATIMLLLGYGVDIEGAFTNVIGPAALLNFILSPFSFVFLVWFHRRSQARGGMGA